MRGFRGEKAEENLQKIAASGLQNESFTRGDVELEECGWFLREVQISTGEEPEERKRRSELGMVKVNREEGQDF